jgi:hypothetical protein
LVADSSHRLNKGDEIGVRIHAESLGIFGPEALELTLISSSLPLLFED